MSRKAPRPYVGLDVHQDTIAVALAEAGKRVRDGGRVTCSNVQRRVRLRERRRLVSC